MITRPHRQEALCRAYVQAVAAQAGLICSRPEPDYGIDLYMETYNDQGEIENEGVWFQLKATESVSVGRSQAIPVRMEWRDLLFWLNERMPGILVVYDAVQDRAWWLHLQKTLRAIKRKKRGRLAVTVTFHIPLDNILNEEAIRGFAKLRNASLASRGDA